MSIQTRIRSLETSTAHIHRGDELCLVMDMLSDGRLMLHWQDGTRRVVTEDEAARIIPERGPGDPHFVPYSTPFGEEGDGLPGDPDYHWLPGEEIPAHPT